MRSSVSKFVRRWNQSELSTQLTSTLPNVPRYFQERYSLGFKPFKPFQKRTVFLRELNYRLKMELQNASKRLEEMSLEIPNGCSGTSQRNANNKRDSYIEWDEYFMAMAFLAAMRSKDPVTQVGACIVNEEKKIVALGYNGMPRGCSDDEFPWGKHNSDKMNSKYLYVCHAELNAILNKNSQDIKNCTLYVGLFPCNECAKVIIQSGIKTVLYMSDKYNAKVETKAAKRMFDAANIAYRQYIPKQEKIVIDFTKINSNNMNQLPSPAKKNI